MIPENGELYTRLDELMGKLYAHTNQDADPEHLQPPASTLPEHALADADDATALEIVGNAYFDVMSDARYARLTDRVATLRENDIMDASVEPPAITICIPIAAMGESEQTIAHTLRLVAAQTGAEKAEVLLYANYNAAKQTDQTQIANRQAMLARLQADAAQSEHPLRVRYVLEGYPSDELAISRIRKDAADIVALDTLERGGGYQHPVLWLDADNTWLTPGLLTAHIERQQTNGRSLTLTTTQNYISMNDLGHEYQPGSTAQKLAAYSEILRRHASHQAPSVDTDPYPEENGLSFSIGTYLLVGGLNTSKKLNESRFFLEAVQRHAWRAQAILGSMAVALRAELPRHQRVYSSGRRHIEHAQRYLDQQQPLQSVDDKAGPYALYDNRDFSSADDTIRMQNIAGRREQPASAPELVQQHVQTIASWYQPAHPTIPDKAAYFAFASRISERLGLVELAEITEVKPNVNPW